MMVRLRGILYCWLVVLMQNVPQTRMSSAFSSRLRSCCSMRTTSLDWYASRCASISLSDEACSFWRELMELMELMGLMGLMVGGIDS